MVILIIIQYSWLINIIINYFIIDKIKHILLLMILIFIKKLNSNHMINLSTQILQSKILKISKLYLKIINKILLKILNYNKFISIKLLKFNSLTIKYKMMW